MKQALIFLFGVASAMAADPGTAVTLLEKNCGACHGASAISGLDVRSRDSLLKGGSRGAAVKPGDKAASLLYQAVAGIGGLKMPPGKGSLSAEDVKALGEWIDSGAPWAAAAAASASPAHSAEAGEAIAVLQKNCVVCHGAAKTSGLDMRSRETLLTGGSRGAAVKPGDRSGSLLFQAASRTGELKMPPGKAAPLAPEDVKRLGAWIDAGAPWNTQASAHAAAPSWWSLKRLTRPPVPPVKDASSVANPIDAFILAKLESKQMRPVAPASKQTLVRRAYFDLWGLPPTPQQIQDFVSDTSPQAWEKLIDKLLASPHYGERWGKYWLDLARYADSGGFEHDVYFPNAWRYRDYVINSLNEDKPYSQFVQEQIAADEIWPDNLELAGTYEVPAEKRKHMEGRIGTGFYTIGPWYPAAALIPESLRADRLADMVDTTAAAFMGMTFGCARCHDHKFDPIPTRDYYRLEAIFAASEEREVPIVDLTKLVDFQKTMPRMLAMNDLQEAVKKLDAREKQRLKAAGAKKLDDGGPRAQATPQEKRLRDEYVRRIGETYLEFPGHYPTANVLAHVEQVPNVYVLKRGDYRNHGDKVEPGLPSVTGDDTESIGRDKRKALALWLTGNDHPLTWRVMVNRLWQGHFVNGLVRTPNDFGRQGEAPTHPELLDWLASELVARGASLKAIHKLIMMSNTYRLSNCEDAKDNAADPENKLLWRMNRRRIEAEAIRDAVLATSGAIDYTMGGAPVAPPLSREEMEGIKEAYQWPATVDAAKAARRSVYLLVKRSFPMPLFSIFDSPDTSVSCARRESTNVAPQALALLNNSLLNQEAARFAERLRKEAGPDVGREIDAAWQLALGRAPTAAEKSRALPLLTAGSDKSALQHFCLMIFNLNEFLYID